MRILGIDPGIGRTGWGIINVEKGVLSVETFGCIETFQTHSVSQRLVLIYEDLSRIIKDTSPDAMAIEDLFFNTNVKTALVVGQARGVVLLLAEQSQLPVGV